MDEFLLTLKKASENKYAFDLQNSNPYKVEDYLDTGCYFLNAIMGNGDIFCGVPKGKRITLAGAPSTAKSFFSAHIIKSFLDKEENSYCVLFESEGASINEMADKLKIDTSRLIILPTFTVEEFKIQSMKILKTIEEERAKLIKSKKTPPSVLFVLDSIGMLSTEKSINDAETGVNKRDMTKQYLLKSAFCNITLLLSMTQTTLINVCHTYQEQGMFPKTIVSGGSGLQYASDVILILSKSKQKAGTETIGAIIKCRVNKSRYIPEEKFTKIVLLFSKGINKWSGFTEFGLLHGILKEEGRSFIFPDETKVQKKIVESDMDKYFNNDEMLKLFRDKILEEYAFGEADESSNLEIKGEEDDVLDNENENENS